MRALQQGDKAARIDHFLGPGPKLFVLGIEEHRTENGLKWDPYGMYPQPRPASLVYLSDGTWEFESNLQLVVGKLTVHKDFRDIFRKQAREIIAEGKYPAFKRVLLYLRDHLGMESPVLIWPDFSPWGWMFQNDHLTGAAIYWPIEGLWTTHT